MHHHSYLTYEDFGRRFFEIAVSKERVASAFAEIAGGEFDIPPMAQGPGKLARVSARVKICEPQVSRDVGQLITFTIHIPLLINMLVDIRVDRQRFEVSGDIILHATAYAAEPLMIIIDVAKPRSSDITVHVVSQSIRGELLRIIGGVDSEIRKFIAQYVAQEIDTPTAQQAQIINIADQVDQAWLGK